MEKYISFVERLTYKKFRFDIMIKYESLQKMLVIAAIAGMPMLLLATSCIAQDSLGKNGTENCTCTCLDHQSLGINFGEECQYSSIPDKATLVSPKETIYVTNPTFIWNPVKYCTEYCLKVAPASQPNEFIFEKCYQAHEVLSDWGCSAKPEELKDRLTQDESYRWWIITKNCMGKSWSNYMEFVYDDDPQLTKPAPISPMGLVSAKTPEFKWTAVPGATKYNLQVIRGTTDNSKVVNAVFNADSITRGDICSVFSPVILPDDVYFWGVRAKNTGDYVPLHLTDKDRLYFENICALKPDGENTTPVEKETIKEGKETNQGENVLIEPKIDLMEKKKDMIADVKEKIDHLKGVQRSGCKCGSSD